MVLQINTIECLTNEFILEISDKLFMQTIAFRTFTHKQTFINKIIDRYVRYKMLENILEIIQV